MGDYSARQDDLANKIEVRLNLHRELVAGRDLKVPLNVVTFAPAVLNLESSAVENYPLANEKNFDRVLSEIEWEDGNDEMFRMVLSAIENLSSIRKSRSEEGSN